MIEKSSLCIIRVNEKAQLRLDKIEIAQRVLRRKKSNLLGQIDHNLTTKGMKLLDIERNEMI